MGLAIAGPENNFGWHVQVLPFMDQTPLYEQFNQNLNYTTAPNLALEDQSFGPMFCPSARTRDQKDDGNDDFTVHYYGVAGAKGPRPTILGLTGSYAHTGNTTTNHGGFSLSGVLTYNRNFKFRDITDGTSNTFMVGEISARTDTAGGCNNNYRPWTQGSTNGSAGAMYACKNIAREIGPPCYQSGSATRLFNDVRFGSMHVGGTHFLMADGAVNFVSENIDFVTYQAVASREDEESRQLVE